MKWTKFFHTAMAIAFVVVGFAGVSHAVEFGSVTDSRDGQTYKTVKIGDLVWMAENLNYDYNKGTAKSYCYDNEPASCKKYGRLYTWAAAMDSAAVFSDNGAGCGNGKTCKVKKPVRGVCPEGWHLPDFAEWDYLYSHEIYWGDLKATTGWEKKDGRSRNGDNGSGFSMLPAGHRHPSGEFFRLGYTAFFWLSEETDSDRALSWLSDGDDCYGDNNMKMFLRFRSQRSRDRRALNWLNNDAGGCHDRIPDKGFASSVRCLKDSE